MFKHNRQAFMFQIPVYIDARKFVVDLGIKSILDVGCGNPQKLRAYIHPFIDDITGLDLPDVVKRIDDCAFGKWIECDLNDGDVDLKRTFGLIIAADVIEHLKNPIGLFDVIKRHANDSTIIIISTPEKLSVKTNNRLHEMEYTKDEMIAIINQNSLCIDETKSYTEKTHNYPYMNNMFLCKKKG